MSSVIVVKRGYRHAVIAAGMRGAPGAGGGGSAGVSSFNTRTGPVTLVSADVSGALGYTPANSADLAGVALSGAYADLLGLPAIPAAPGDVGAATAAQGAKADTAVQPGELASVAASGSYADLSAKPFIPALPGDIGAATAAQGAKADTAVQPAALTSGLAGKVDKDGAKVLSDQNYTLAEKNKLAGLDGAPFKGLHINLAALQSAHPSAAAGDYADVDSGTGADVARYIWDTSGTAWVEQTGGGAGMANPMTTAGDMIVGGAAGVPSRLGLGLAGQVLAVNAGRTGLEYQTPAAGGGGGGTPIVTVNWSPDVIPVPAAIGQLMKIDDSSTMFIAQNVDSSYGWKLISGSALVAGMGMNATQTSSPPNFQHNVVKNKIAFSAPENIVSPVTKYAAISLPTLPMGVKLLDPLEVKVWGIGAQPITLKLQIFDSDYSATDISFLVGNNVSIPVVRNGDWIEATITQDVELSISMNCFDDGNGNPYLEAEIKVKLAADTPIYGMGK